jgi:hypothetical protein
MAGYEDTRAAVATLGGVCWVSAGRGRFGRRIPVPLPTLFVDYLLRHHVARSIAALERRYRALAAITPSETLRAELEHLDNFARSIVPVPSRRLMLAFVLAVLLVAFLLSDLVFRAREEAQGTAGAIRALSTLDRSGLADTLEAFDRGETLGGAFILGLSACFVLWLPAASFQIKRLLLAAHPRGREALAEASLGAVEPSGVYRLERRTFAAVDSRPPRELRLDRIFGAALLVIPLWGALVLGTLGLLGAHGQVTGLGHWHALVLVLAAGLLLLWATSRLVSLARPREKRGRAHRLVAVALVASASAVATLVAVSTGGVAAGKVLARFQGVALTTNVPLATYLSRERSPTRIRQHVEQSGVVLTFGVLIDAPNGTRLQSRYSIVDARSGQVFRSQLGPAFSARAQEMTGSVDASNLLLLRLSRVTTDVGSRTTSVLTRSNVWVGFSGRSGRFVLRLQLYDSQDLLLASFRTTPFTVRALGRFRTRGRVSTATVQG